ncbi:hypothetical protein IFR05_013778 [Cadophora sp. M221]|nr:hypothetical protein IFR05_013778 [Cadophora sp. M221]
MEYAYSEDVRGPSGKPEEKLCAETGTWVASSNHTQSPTSIINSSDFRNETNPLTQPCKNQQTTGLLEPSLNFANFHWEKALPEPQVVEVEWSSDLDDCFYRMHSGRKPCSHLSVCKESRGVYLKAWLPIFPYLPSNAHLEDVEASRSHSRAPVSPSLLPYPESPTSSASRYDMGTNHRYSKQTDACPTSSEKPPALTAKVTFSTCYFNAKIDTLFVLPDGFVGFGLEKTIGALNAVTNLNALQHLALEFSFICLDGIQMQPAVVSSLMKFQKLKEVNIVCENSNWISHWMWGALQTPGAVSLESYT